MKATLISDLHGNLIDLKKYSSDLLLISGDICPTRDHSIGYQVNWMNQKFHPWVVKQKEYFDEIIFICGNHDWWGVKHHDAVITKPAIYLNRSSYEYKGLKIWGFAEQLPFFDWAFNEPEERLEVIYSKVDRADIILSHGPPFDYGDKAPRYRKDGQPGFERTGSKALVNLIDRVKPKLCTFGHIHPGYGIYQRDETKLVNCALLNDRYELVNEPIIICV